MHRINEGRNVVLAGIANQVKRYPTKNRTIQLKYKLAFLNIFIALILSIACLDILAVFRIMQAQSREAVKS